MTLTYIMILITLFFLSLMRARLITKAIIDWNYYVYRYRVYCRLNYISDERSEDRIISNEATVADFLFIFIQVWKIIPENFFTHKPDYKEIFELYYEP